MGGPEFEVHTAKKDASDQYVRPFTCAGEHAIPASRFDAGTGPWAGNALLLTEQELVQWDNNQAYGEIMVWEDDNGSCVIKTDVDWLEATYAAAGIYFGGRWAWLWLFAAAASTYALGFGLVLAASFWAVNAFSNDDFVGRVFPTAALGVSHPNASFAILGPSGQIAGYLQLEGNISAHWNPPPPPPPPPPSLSAYISGPEVIQQEDAYTWTAVASGGANYTYAWTIYYAATGQLIGGGTSQTEQLTVLTGTGTFEMRVTVTSGNASVMTSLTVANCIGMPGCLDQ